MKTYSISELGRAFGLSRSTLLYYDRIGVLAPSGRRASAYRYYTTRDYRRLERICHFRKAGLALKEIRTVLAAGGKPGAPLLKKRLHETAANLLTLRKQQRLLSGMLNRIASGVVAPAVDKAMWVEILRGSGLDEEGMHRWHVEFERRSPEGHHEFLTTLGMPLQEIRKIRQWSRSEAGGEERTMIK